MQEKIEIKKNKKDRKKEREKKRERENLESCPPDEIFGDHVARKKFPPFTLVYKHVYPTWSRAWIDYTPFLIEKSVV